MTCTNPVGLIPARGKHCARFWQETCCGGGGGGEGGGLLV